MDQEKLQWDVNAFAHRSRNPLPEDKLPTWDLQHILSEHAQVLHRVTNMQNQGTLLSNYQRLQTFIVHMLAKVSEIRTQTQQMQTNIRRVTAQRTQTADETEHDIQHDLQMMLETEQLSGSSAPLPWEFQVITDYYIHLLCLHIHRAQALQLRKSQNWCTLGCASSSSLGKCDVFGNSNTPLSSHWIQIRGWW